MSSAAVIQLAAEGPQDVVIRGEDEGDFTLWKAMITRYSNYSTDFQEVELSSGVQYGGKASATLTRYGDLIDGIFVEFTLVPLASPNLVDSSGNAYTVQGAYYCNAIGYTVLASAELLIGGTSIQKTTTENFWTYEELMLGSGRRLRDLIGRFDYSDDVEDSMIEWSGMQQKIYVPLPFYNYIYGEKSLAIPMVALYKHDIVVKLTFNALSDCVASVYKPASAHASTDPYFLSSTTPLNDTTSATLANSDLQARLLVSYVYISENERVAMSSNELQYIIVQDQNMSFSISASATTTTTQIHFSHPMIFVDWRARPTNWNVSAGRRRYSVGFKDRFDYSMYVADSDYTYGTVSDFFSTAQLNFNSHNRFPTDVAPRFFSELMSHLAGKCQFTGYEYLWCFAANVYEFNPTSTCNFSRIDNITIKFTHPSSLPACDCYIHGANYNQGIATDGMWGLRFSS